MHNTSINIRTREHGNERKTTREIASLRKLLGEKNRQAKNGGPEGRR